MMRRKYLGFFLGGELFGIDLECVHNVERDINITPVLTAPEGIAGITNIRGRVFTVFDLCKIFGVERSPSTEYVKCICLKTSKTGDNPTCLLIDDVNNIGESEDEDILKPAFPEGDTKRRYIGGVKVIGDTMICIIDIDELLHVFIRRE